MPKQIATTKSLPTIPLLYPDLRAFIVDSSETAAAALKAQLPRYCRAFTHVSYSIKAQLAPMFQEFIVCLAAMEDMRPEISRGVQRTRAICEVTGPMILSDMQAFAKSSNEFLLSFKETSSLLRKYLDHSKMLRDRMVEILRDVLSPRQVALLDSHGWPLAFAALAIMYIQYIAI